MIHPSRKLLETKNIRLFEIQVKIVKKTTRGVLKLREVSMAFFTPTLTGPDSGQRVGKV